MPNKHPQDPDLLSSPATIRETVESNSFYRDMVNFFTSRIEIHQKILESVTDINVICHSQGVIANCRDFLELPEKFIEWYEEDRNTEGDQDAGTN